jgi:acetyl-CoA carboxylase carboxyltransferase component
MIRHLLGYLPANHNQEPPAYACSDDVPDRLDDTLEGLVPANFRQSYDMREVILRVVDNRDFLEVLPRFAPNIVIGLARMEGRTVGIVGNQPSHLAGCLDVDSSDKAARFIRFCDAFNIPLVNFVDVPGYFPGVNPGALRHHPPRCQDALRL